MDNLRKANTLFGKAIVDLNDTENAEAVDTVMSMTLRDLCHLILFNAPSEVLDADLPTAIDMLSKLDENEGGD